MEHPKEFFNLDHFYGKDTKMIVSTSITVTGHQSLYNRRTTLSSWVITLVVEPYDSVSSFYLEDTLPFLRSRRNNLSKPLTTFTQTKIEYYSLIPYTGEKKKKNFESEQNIFILDISIIFVVMLITVFIRK